MIREDCGRGGDDRPLWEENPLARARQTVATEELPVRGFGRNVYEAAWVGELEAPRDIPLRTPREKGNWRVTVEEWERLKGDPADLADAHSSPVWEQRLIYADEIGL